jgi:hypothetical protein
LALPDGELKNATEAVVVRLMNAYLQTKPQREAMIPRLISRIRRR